MESANQTEMETDASSGKPYQKSYESFLLANDINLPKQLTNGGVVYNNGGQNSGLSGNNDQIYYCEVPQCGQNFVNFALLKQHFDHQHPGITNQLKDPQQPKTSSVGTMNEGKVKALKRKRKPIVIKQQLTKTPNQAFYCKIKGCQEKSFGNFIWLKRHYNQMHPEEASKMTRNSYLMMEGSSSTQQTPNRNEVKSDSTKKRKVSALENVVNQEHNTLETSSGASYYCDRCKKKFANWSVYKRHYNQKHPELTQFLQKNEMSPGTSAQTGNTSSSVAVETVAVAAPQTGHVHNSDHNEPDPADSCENCQGLVHLMRNHLVEIAAGKHSEIKSGLSEREIMGHLTEALGYHQDQIKKMIQNSKKPYHCRHHQCKKAYRSKKDLHEHVKSHFKRKLYVCGNCDKEFKNKELYQSHAGHCAKKPLDCFVKGCTTVCATYSLLKRHFKQAHPGLSA